ncbi:hypothetical protein ACQKQA_07020 [Pseudomonas sp. NPDC089530]|uniref:hypothetical protein n=1 Tax=Pseudomonas sp. NPDC089530 TaxID=3390651 RepID=UPI003D026328
MAAPHFIIDSLTISKATPKRRHVDLRTSLTDALNEFVELGLFESVESAEGLTTWQMIGGAVVAQEMIYEDIFKRPQKLTQLTRDAALGIILRARHSGDRAALVEAIRKA